MTHASETTFDILAYLRRLGRQFLASALVGLLVAAGAFLLLHRTPPAYTATSTLLFQPPKVATEAEAMQQGNNSQAQLRNYRQLVSSPVFLQPMSARLGGTPDADALTTTLIAVWVPGSQMMTFSYTADTEQKAIEVANTAAELFKDKSVEWSAGQDKSLVIPVTKVIPASSPVTVVHPSLVKQALMALVGGLVAALLCAMALDALAARRHGPRALPADAA